ncbi:MAG TPA: FadR/GntR family transcriptional regulator [Burkholderiales bacterium]
MTPSAYTPLPPDDDARESDPASILGALGPLPPAQSRSGELIDRLTAQITEGRLTPGDKLPTEQEMMAAFGVSRTVVREAVAALRSEGLVETRHGVGAFVCADLQKRPFRIDPAEFRSIGDVVNLMELRIGVEVEAAGLAAERITPASRDRLQRALKALDGAMARGQSGVAEDFHFHQAIAYAARNPQFGRFLEFLERFLIPRKRVRTGLEKPQDLKAYLERIQGEHRRIVEAIVAGDSAAARQAMRKHLSNSRRRYEGLAKAVPGRNPP